jgi:hypothetical protein
MAKKKVDTRKLACVHCGKEHYFQHGGWVIAGDKKAYCHSASTGSCLVAFYKQNGGNHGRSAKISDYWREL